MAAVPTNGDRLPALLLRIPLEASGPVDLNLWPPTLRVEIYRYAVQLPIAIQPNQLASHSNKFRRSEVFARQLDAQSAPSALAVTQLALTCRQIYNELAALPVFYEVNEFLFFCPHNLLAFLVALTPRRRAQIRTIILKSQPRNVLGPAAWGGWVPSYTRHAVAMLSQCTALREFRWECASTDPFLYLGVGTERFTSLLTAACREAAAVADLPHDITSYFSLPMFSLVIFPGTPQSLDLTVRISERPSSIGKEVPDHVWANVVRTIDILAERKRALVSLHEECAGVLHSITEQEIKEAILAARIDFPGEDRVHLNRFNTTVGSVSSRTRRQCNNKVTSDGVIDRNPTGKYTATGLLIRPFFCVNELRWASDEETIECNVSLSLKDDSWDMTSVERTWETLDAIACRNGFSQLQHYYNRQVGIFSTNRSWLDLDDAEKRLTHVEQIPSPKSVLPHMQQVLEENPKARGGMTSSWTKMQKKWADMLQKVRNHVETARELKRQEDERKERERVRQENEEKEERERVRQEKDDKERSKQGTTQKKKAGRVGGPRPLSIRPTSLNYQNHGSVRKSARCAKLATVVRKTSGGK